MPSSAKKPLSSSHQRRFCGQRPTEFRHPSSSPLQFDSCHSLLLLQHPPFVEVDLYAPFELGKGRRMGKRWLPEKKKNGDDTGLKIARIGERKKKKASVCKNALQREYHHRAFQLFFMKLFLFVKNQNLLYFFLVSTSDSKQNISHLIALHKLLPVTDDVITQP